MTGLPAAGWYVNEYRNGELQWWDGGAWVENATPASAPELAPIQTPVQALAPAPADPFAPTMFAERPIADPIPPAPASTPAASHTELVPYTPAAVAPIAQPTYYDHAMPSYQAPAAQPTVMVTQQQAYPGAVLVRPMKSAGLAFVLGFFLGQFGAHFFYLGKTGQGVAFVLCNWLLLPLIFVPIIGWAVRIGMLVWFIVSLCMVGKWAAERNAQLAQVPQVVVTTSY